MYIGAEHHRIIRSELSEIGERHRMSVLSFTPKLVSELFEPDRPLNKPYIESVKVNINSKFQELLNSIETTLFQLLEKMEVNSISNDDKNRICNLTDSLISIETYERAMDAIFPNIESHSARYGISLNEHQWNGISRQCQIHRSLVVSHSHGVKKRFLRHIENELSILVLRHEDNSSKRGTTNMGLEDTKNTLLELQRLSSGDNRVILKQGNEIADTFSPSDYYVRDGDSYNPKPIHTDTFHELTNAGYLIKEKENTYKLSGEPAVSFEEMKENSKGGVTPAKKGWKTWSTPTKLEIIAAIVAILGFGGYLIEKSFDVSNYFSAQEKQDVSLIYQDLFDTSKRILRDLQPSEVNIFDNHPKIEKTIESLIFEVEKQLLPQGLVVVVTPPINGVLPGQYALKLTPLGKAVRAYVLTNEPGPGFFKTVTDVN